MEFFSVRSPSPKLILLAKCKESTVIKLQKRLLEQGTGGQLPIEPGRGASGLGGINTHKNNCKLNALSSMTQSNDSSWLCSKDHSSLSPVLSAYFFYVSI